MKEVFKDVVGFEGEYQISNFGRVKTLKPRSEVYIKPSNRNGYLRVGLRKNNKRYSKSVHRLVGEAFIGVPKKGMQINHKNGIKDDNRVCNLEWVTHSENIRHAFRTKLLVRPKGEKNHNATLTNEQALEIRAMYPLGCFTKQEIADAYGVSFSCVKNILSRKTYSHI